MRGQEEENRQLASVLCRYWPAAVPVVVTVTVAVATDPLSLIELGGGPCRSKTSRANAHGVNPEMGGPATTRAAKKSQSGDRL
jgi:hypothetical protein